MKKEEFENSVLVLSDKVYLMMLRLLGNQQNTQDALQEVMIKLWDKRQQLKDHPNIKGFVFLTARNYCLDILKKRAPYFDYSDHSNVLISADFSELGIEKKELYSHIEKIINSLPSLQAEIMMMRAIEGLEYAEIATALDLKTEHVRVLISRARKQVGEKLKTVYSYDK